MKEEEEGIRNTHRRSIRIYDLDSHYLWKKSLNALRGTRGKGKGPENLRNSFGSNFETYVLL